jgi:hypothetical protein
MCFHDIERRRFAQVARRLRDEYVSECDTFTSFVGGSLAFLREVLDVPERDLSCARDYLIANGQIDVLARLDEKRRKAPRLGKSSSGSLQPRGTSFKV